MDSRVEVNVVSFSVSLVPLPCFCGFCVYGGWLKAPVAGLGFGELWGFRGVKG